MRMRSRRLALSRRAAAAGVATAALAALVACSSGADGASGSAGPDTSSTPGVVSDGGGSDQGGTDKGATATSADLTVHDAWGKAADDGMTGVFAEITNNGPKAITITGGSSEAAHMVQLHGTEGNAKGGMTMKEKEGGFTIEPGASLTLEPGGDHIMLMDLTGPLKPGDEVAIDLELADGSTLELTAQIRDFAGAQEDYAPGHGGASDGGH